MPHTPVLLKETIEILNPQPGEFFIDGTIGSGGHSAAILERVSPGGVLLGIDWDKKMIEVMREKIAANSKIKIQNSKLILVHGNYADLPEILKKIRKADPSIPLRAGGLILDLGFSSEQLEKSGRGFTFQKNEPLDMRYNTENISINQFNNQYKSAAVIVNNYSEKELAEIFWKYGEERYSRQIARKIIALRQAQGSKRPIKTTFDLVEIIQKAIPPSHCHRHSHRQIHPATRVFQALRIYVNNELENLDKLSKNISKIVKNKGRVVIISYHSLEDRLVKNCFRELKNQGKAQILTNPEGKPSVSYGARKPIRPTNEEIQANPRSRSAKLRAITLT